MSFAGSGVGVGQVDRHCAQLSSTPSPLECRPEVVPREWVDVVVTVGRWLWQLAAISRASCGRRGISLPHLHQLAPSEWTEWNEVR